MQNLAIERMGNQYAVTVNDMRILRAAFGNPTIALHPRIISALRDCHILHQRSVQQLRRFDIRPAPTQIWHCHYA